MTWQEVLETNHRVVKVLSYGYTERSLFSSHFEPFRHKREFSFKINRRFSMLEHDWLFLEEQESDLYFEERNGSIVLDDPDLWAR